MGQWTDFPLPDGSYSDATRPWTQQDVVNFLPTFAEGAGTRSKSKYTPVPGLLTFGVFGAGPHRGGRDVEGKCFVVSGSTLYQISPLGIVTTIGTIPGTGLVSMTHNQIDGGNQLLIGTGDNSYVYDTVLGTLTANGVPLLTVDFLNQLNLGVDQARRFWRYSGLADAKSWNTLDNESAESSPDRIVGGIVAQGEWLVFGERTIEPWANDATATTAFQRQTGAIAERGCINANTIKRLDNSVFFVDNNCIPCRLNGYQPVPIAPKAIVEALSRSDPQKLLAYTWEDKGYVVYYVTCQDGQTWGYDCTSQKWHRRESYGLNRWRLNTLFKWIGDWYGGDYLNGKLYRLTWGNVFEGCDIMPRRLRSGVLHNNGNKVFVAAVKIAVQTGGVEHTCPPELSIEGGVLPDACDDEDYIATLTLSEGSGTYVQASFVSGADTYPAGTSLNIVDNHLTLEFFNAPAGTYRPWIKVVDSEGVSSIPFECVIVVHHIELTGSLPTASVGDTVSYQYTLTSSVAGESLSATISAGALPTGLSMSSSGLVTGSPTTTGTFNWTIQLAGAVCTEIFTDSTVITVGSAGRVKLLASNTEYYGTLGSLTANTFNEAPTLPGGRQAIASSSTGTTLAYCDLGTTTLHIYRWNGSNYVSQTITGSATLGANPYICISADGAWVYTATTFGAHYKAYQYNGSGYTLKTSADYSTDGGGHGLWGLCLSPSNAQICWTVNGSLYRYNISATDGSLSTGSNASLGFGTGTVDYEQMDWVGNYIVGASGASGARFAVYNASTLAQLATTGSTYPYLSFAYFSADTAHIYAALQPGGLGQENITVFAFNGTTLTAGTSYDLVTSAYGDFAINYARTHLVRSATGVPYAISGASLTALTALGSFPTGSDAQTLCWTNLP